MTENELEEIEARAARATPGPWTYEAEDYNGDNWLVGSILAGNSCLDGKDYCVHITTDHVRASRLYRGSDASTDADFIAHARSDIPHLVREVRRLQAKLADLEHERADNHVLLWKVAEQQNELERLRAIVDCGVAITGQLQRNLS
jgi:hypothetical protein